MAVLLVYVGVLMKPTEVKLVASLLDQEWDDVNELAKAIISGVDDKREKDDKPYAIIAQYRIGEGLITQTYGPFATANQAEKGVKHLSSPGPQPGRYMIVRLKSPKEAEQWDS